MPLEFEEENLNYFKAQENKGLIGWLIDKGLAKNRKGAEYILLIIAVICVVATVVIWMRGTNNTRVEPLTEAQLQQLPESIREDFRDRQ